MALRVEPGGANKKQPAKRSAAVEALLGRPVAPKRAVVQSGRRSAQRQIAANAAANAARRAEERSATAARGDVLDTTEAYRGRNTQQNSARQKAQADAAARVRAAEVASNARRVQAKPETRVFDDYQLYRNALEGGYAEDRNAGRVSDHEDVYAFQGRHEQAQAQAQRAAEGDYRNDLRVADRSGEALNERQQQVIDYKQAVSDSRKELASARAQSLIQQRAAETARVVGKNDRPHVSDYGGGYIPSGADRPVTVRARPAAQPAPADAYVARNQAQARGARSQLESGLGELARQSEGYQDPWGTGTVRNLATDMARDYGMAQDVYNRGRQELGATRDSWLNALRGMPDSQRPAAAELFASRGSSVPELAKDVYRWRQGDTGAAPSSGYVPRGATSESATERGRVLAAYRASVASGASDADARDAATGKLGGLNQFALGATEDPFTYTGMASGALAGKLPAAGRWLERGLEGAEWLLDPAGEALGRAGMGALGLGKDALGAGIRGARGLVGDAAGDAGDYFGRAAVGFGETLGGPPLSRPRAATGRVADPGLEGADLSQVSGGPSNKDVYQGTQGVPPALLPGGGMPEADRRRALLAFLRARAEGRAPEGPNQYGHTRGQLPEVTPGELRNQPGTQPGRRMLTSQYDDTPPREAVRQRFTSSVPMAVRQPETAASIEDLVETGDESPRGSSQSAPGTGPRTRTAYRYDPQTGEERGVIGEVPVSGRFRRETEGSRNLTPPDLLVDIFNADDGKNQMAQEWARDVLSWHFERNQEMPAPLVTRAMRMLYPKEMAAPAAPAVQGPQRFRPRTRRGMADSSTPRAPRKGRFDGPGQLNQTLENQPLWEQDAWGNWLRSDADSDLEFGESAESLLEQRLAYNKLLEDYLDRDVDRPAGRSGETSELYAARVARDREARATRQARYARTMGSDVSEQDLQALRLAFAKDPALRGLIDFETAARLYPQLNKAGVYQWLVDLKLREAEQRLMTYDQQRYAGLPADSELRRNAPIRGLEPEAEFTLTPEDLAGERPITAEEAARQEGFINSLKQNHQKALDRERVALHNQQTKRGVARQQIWNRRRALDRKVGLIEEVPVGPGQFSPWIQHLLERAQHKATGVRGDWSNLPQFDDWQEQARRNALFLKTQKSLDEWTLKRDDALMQGDDAAAAAAQAQIDRHNSAIGSELDQALDLIDTKGPDVMRQQLLGEATAYDEDIDDPGFRNRPLPEQQHLRGQQRAEHDAIADRLNARYHQLVVARQDAIQRIQQEQDMWLERERAENPGNIEMPEPVENAPEVRHYDTLIADAREELYNFAGKYQAGYTPSPQAPTGTNWRPIDPETFTFVDPGTGLEERIPEEYWRRVPDKEQALRAAYDGDPGPMYDVDTDKLPDDLFAAIYRTPVEELPVREIWRKRPTQGVDETVVRRAEGGPVQPPELEGPAGELRDELLDEVVAPGYLTKAGGGASILKPDFETGQEQELAETLIPQDLAAGMRGTSGEMRRITEAIDSMLNGSRYGEEDVPYDGAVPTAFSRADEWEQRAKDSHADSFYGRDWATKRVPDPKRPGKYKTVPGNAEWLVANQAELARNPRAKAVYDWVVPSPGTGPRVAGGARSAGYKGTSAGVRTFPYERPASGKAARLVGTPDDEATRLETLGERATFWVAEDASLQPNEEGAYSGALADMAEGLDNLDPDHWLPATLRRMQQNGDVDPASVSRYVTGISDPAEQAFMQQQLARAVEERGYAVAVNQLSDGKRAASNVLRKEVVPAAREATRLFRRMSEEQRPPSSARYRRDLADLTKALKQWRAGLAEFEHLGQQAQTAFDKLAARQPEDPDARPAHEDWKRRQGYWFDSMNGTASRLALPGKTAAAFLQDFEPESLADLGIDDGSVGANIRRSDQLYSRLLSHMRQTRDTLRAVRNEDLTDPIKEQSWRIQQARMLEGWETMRAQLRDKLLEMSDAVPEGLPTERFYLSEGSPDDFVDLPVSANGWRLARAVREWEPPRTASRAEDAALLAAKGNRVAPPDALKPGPRVSTSRNDIRLNMPRPVVGAPVPDPLNLRAADPKRPPLVGRRLEPFERTKNEQALATLLARIDEIANTEIPDAMAKGKKGIAAMLQSDLDDLTRRSETMQRKLAEQQARPGTPAPDAPEPTPEVVPTEVTPEPTPAQPEVKTQKVPAIPGGEVERLLKRKPNATQQELVAARTKDIQRLRREASGGQGGSDVVPTDDFAGDPFAGEQTWREPGSEYADADTSMYDVAGGGGSRAGRQTPEEQALDDEITEELLGSDLTWNQARQIVLDRRSQGARRESSGAGPRATHFDETTDNSPFPRRRPPKNAPEGYGTVHNFNPQPVSARAPTSTGAGYPDWATTPALRRAWDNLQAQDQDQAFGQGVDATRARDDRYRNLQGQRDLRRRGGGGRGRDAVPGADDMFTGDPFAGVQEWQEPGAEYAGMGDTSMYNRTPGGGGPGTIDVPGATAGRTSNATTLRDHGMQHEGMIQALALAMDENPDVGAKLLHAFRQRDQMLKNKTPGDPWGPINAAANQLNSEFEDTYGTIGPDNVKETRAEVAAEDLAGRRTSRGYYGRREAKELSREQEFALKDAVRAFGYEESDFVQMRAEIKKQAAAGGVAEHTISKPIVDAMIAAGKGATEININGTRIPLNVRPEPTRPGSDWKGRLAYSAITAMVVAAVGGGIAYAVGIPQRDFYYERELQNARGDLEGYMTPGMAEEIGKYLGVQLNPGWINARATELAKEVPPQDLIFNRQKIIDQAINEFLAQQAGLKSTGDSSYLDVATRRDLQRMSTLANALSSFTPPKNADELYTELDALKVKYPDALDITGAGGVQRPRGAIQMKPGAAQEQSKIQDLLQEYEDVENPWEKAQLKHEIWAQAQLRAGDLGDLKMPEDFGLGVTLKDWAAQPEPLAVSEQAMTTAQEVGPMAAQALQDYRDADYGDASEADVQAAFDEYVELDDEHKFWVRYVAEKAVQDMTGSPGAIARQKMAIARQLGVDWGEVLAVTEAPTSWMKSHSVDQLLDYYDTELEKIGELPFVGDKSIRGGGLQQVKRHNQPTRIRPPGSGRTMPPPSTGPATGGGTVPPPASGAPGSGRTRKPVVAAPGKSGGSNFPFKPGGYAGTQRLGGQEVAMYYGDTPNAPLIPETALTKGSAASAGGSGTGGFPFEPGGYAGARNNGKGQLVDMYYGNTPGAPLIPETALTKGSARGAGDTGTRASPFPFEPGGYAGSRVHNGQLMAFYYGATPDAPQVPESEIAEYERPAPAAAPATGTARPSQYPFTPGGYAGRRVVNGRLENVYYGDVEDDLIPESDLEVYERPQAAAGASPTIYSPPRPGDSPFRKIGGAWYGWDGQDWVPQDEGQGAASSSDAAGSPRSYERTSSRPSSGGGSPSSYGGSSRSEPFTFAQMESRDRNNIYAYFAGMLSRELAASIAARYGLTLERLSQMFHARENYLAYPTAPVRAKYS